MQAYATGPADWSIEPFSDFHRPNTVMKPALLCLSNHSRFIYTNAN